MDRKRVLLVGASSSIGKEIKSNLDAYDFISTSSNVLDLKDPDSIDGFCQTLDSNNKLYGVIICSGVIKTVPLAVTSSKHLNDYIHEIFSVNCFGQIVLMNALLKKRLIAENGSVIFINSISKDVLAVGNSIYGASKKAMKSFTDFLVFEQSKRKKIRFNSISPGQLVSGVADNVYTNPEDESKYPMGYGSPSDIVGAVKLLLSEESKWINGADIIIDGGRSIR